MERSGTRLASSVVNEQLGGVGGGGGGGGLTRKDNAEARRRKKLQRCRYFNIFLADAVICRPTEDGGQGRGTQAQRVAGGGGGGGRAGGRGGVSQCTTVLNVVARGLQGPGSIISGLEGKPIDRVTIYSSPRADKWQTDQR